MVCSFSDAAFSYISPVFATRGNLSNFLRSIPVLRIATLGVAMLMISGGIDLSCGAITACAGTMAAYLAVYGCHPVSMCGSRHSVRRGLGTFKRF
ncbi:MAG: hypothetical protein ACLTW9_18525 [Enterocloster sp.]